jgi:hypothetical protein
MRCTGSRTWVEAPQDVFVQRVTQALAGDRWVADGNYGRIAWDRAETVLWLDYPLCVTAGRLLRRTLRRALNREELWNGNREPLLRSFTRDSLFLWLLRTYRSGRREYEASMKARTHADSAVVRLRSPAQTRAWLARLEQEVGGSLDPKLAPTRTYGVLAST